MSMVTEHAVAIEMPKTGIEVPKETTLSSKKVLLHLCCGSAVLVLPICATDTVDFVDKQLRNFLPGSRSWALMSNGETSVESSARLEDVVNDIDNPVLYVQFDDDPHLTLTHGKSDDEDSEQEEKETFAATQLREQEANDRLLKRSLIYPIGIRCPWLLLAIVGGLAAGLVIDEFEDELEKVAPIAFYIPLVMDMGGNMGTQAATILTRGVSAGTINKSNYLYFLAREFFISCCTGLTIGTLCSIFVWVWLGEVRTEEYATDLTLSAGVSMFIVSVTGSMLGFGVPFLANLMRFDSAAVSDPIITTVMDIFGLCAYFGIVTSIMSKFLSRVSSSEEA